MSTDLDAVEYVKSEHRRFFAMFAELDGKQGEDKRAHFREIVQSLSAHEAVEELILWPTVRAEVPEGEQLAAQRQSEEQHLQELLADLDGMAVDDPRFDQTAKRFFDEVREHAGLEEAEVLPKLREHADAELLGKLGAAMDLAMKAAPTRPHPNVPSDALGNLAAGPMAAVVDRVRDAAEEAMAKLRGSG